jgi:hypothetical protein
MRLCSPPTRGWFKHMDLTRSEARGDGGEGGSTLALAAIINVVVDALAELTSNCQLSPRVGRGSSANSPQRAEIAGPRHSRKVSAAPLV